MLNNETSKPALFLKVGCKTCGTPILAIGTGRRFCIEHDKGLNKTLKARVAKACLTEKQMMALLEVQSAWMKLNKVELTKQLILDEFQKMAEQEAIFKAVLERNGLDTNGRRIKEKASEVGITSKAR